MAWIEEVPDPFEIKLSQLRMPKRARAFKKPTPEQLATFIQKFTQGLIPPIAIRGKSVVVDGVQRIEMARLAGFKTIKAIRVQDV